MRTHVGGDRQQGTTRTAVSREIDEIGSAEHRQSGVGRGEKAAKNHEHDSRYDENRDHGCDLALSLAHREADQEVALQGEHLLLLLGLGVIIVLSYKTGSLGPIWFVAIAYLAGALTTFQAYRMRDDWRAGAAHRAFRKQQKGR